jgi:hypothetical protein
VAALATPVVLPPTTPAAGRGGGGAGQGVETAAGRFGVRETSGVHSRAVCGLLDAYLCTQLPAAWYCHVQYVKRVMCAACQA